MTKTCKQCSAPFEITPEDLAFYEKISPVFNGKKELVPAPTLCPDCRHQRRLALRNERSLYRRTCSLCRKSLIANYAADVALPVYCLDCWWGDRWSPLMFGRVLQLDRSFIDQFLALSIAVPRPSAQILNGQNCDYTNFCRDGKDCYLSFSIVHCEECLYSTHTDESLNCVDCEGDEHCEYCYECCNCIGCFHLTHSVRCENCHDASFLYDCKNCQHCCLSSNLRSRQYVFQNQQLDAEEYEQRLRSMRMETSSGLKQAGTQFDTILRHAIHHTLITQCENCTGDVLKNCKNCRECFDCFSGEDSVRCYRSPPTFRDCIDSWGVYGGSELCIEASNGKNIQRTLATIQCQNLSDSYYCIHCHNATHLFGCIGIHHAQYCILNKQYTKEEYEKLVPKIIAHMRETGEWGEFFPVSLSPFAYNETVAQEYFPLTKEEVQKRGWQWREEKEEAPKVAKVIPAEKLPDAIDDVPDDILNWAIECEATKRPFRIIKQELDFYRKMQLPIPHFHPDERHRRRLALRNPRKLWKRPCMKCGKQMETTYAPERPEIVYCEDCYLKEVY